MMKHNIACAEIKQKVSKGHENIFHAQFLLAYILFLPQQLESVWKKCTLAGHRSSLC